MRTVEARAADAQRYLKCPMGHVLGVETAGLHIVRHGGRTLVGHLLSQRCEQCGGLWESPDLPKLSALLDRLSENPEAQAMRDSLNQALGPRAGYAQPDNAVQRA